MITKEGWGKIRRHNIENFQAALGEAMSNTPDLEARCFCRGTKTGTWLMVPPSTVNGADLGYQKWRDTFFLRYVINPPDFPPNYDRCGSALYISHSLNCKNGSLITTRHNKLRGGVANLAINAFTPSYVCYNPLIYLIHELR